MCFCCLDLLQHQFTVTRFADVSDNTDSHWEIRAFHLSNHQLEASVGLVWIMDKDIIYCDTVFAESDHFELVCFLVVKEG